MPAIKNVYIWRKAPFLRLVLPLLAGLILQFYLKISISILLIASAVVIILLISQSFFTATKKFRYLKFSGFFIQLLIFFTGMVIMHLYQVKNNKEWYGHTLSSAKTFIIQLQKIEEKPKTIKALVSIVRADDQKVSGKALVYFYKSDSSRLLQQGDLLIIKNGFQRIVATGNPGSFDYANYMAHQQIFHQAFLNNDQWTALHKNNFTFVQRFVSVAVRYANKVIDKYITGNDEKALAKALLTGDRTNMDTELIQAYSNAGVVHLMAISGLHLGLIFMILLKITALFSIFTCNRFLKLFIILGGLWLFAITTGASPSVLRAAFMFTFLSVGIALNKQGASFNSLAASAFILLVFDPMLIFNVGFQLSYCAVLGILSIQKPLEKLIAFNNKILVYAWQLVTVSIAAQLFTLPLCVYYFHQIPLLFLVANLAAIPLASIGLWLGVALIMFGWSGLAGVSLGFVVTQIFSRLNAFVRYIDSLNFVVWRGFYPDLVQTFLLFLILAAASVWLIKKYKPAFFMLSVCALLLFISLSVDKFYASGQRKLIVYNIPGVTAIDIFTGQNAHFVGHVSGKETDVIVTSRQIYKIKKILKIPVKSAFEGVEFYASPVKLLHIKGRYQLKNPIKPIQVDYILISENAMVDFAVLKDQFICRRFIFDATNKRYLVEKWKKQCEELNLPTHDIAGQGALVINL